jgi:hypothetical protein
LPKRIVTHSNRRIEKITIQGSNLNILSNENNTVNKTKIMESGTRQQMQHLTNKTTI